MKLDIRLPIGGMFVLLGGLLTTYGWLSPTEIYRRSLGININLAWGVVMLLFGAAVLAMGCRRGRR